MSEAVRLLADGAGVTEACLGAGFSDTSHFIALFKKRFGKTPLEYKKQIGKPICFIVWFNQNKIIRNCDTSTTAIRAIG